MADVGTTWYTWLEQGRAIRISRDALERIAHALRLSRTDTEYFVALAQGDASEASLGVDIDPPIRQIVESVDRAPAFAIDPLAYVVAFNHLADAVFGFDAPGSRFGRNHLWRMFGDPARIALYGDSWDAVATNNVGIVRANYASRIGHPGFEELLVALHATGREFRRRWEGHYTAPISQTHLITLVHERLGRLTTHGACLAFPERPGYAMRVVLPGDNATAAIFCRLAGEAAEAATAPKPRTRKSRHR